MLSAAHPHTRTIPSVNNLGSVHNNSIRQSPKVQNCSVPFTKTPQCPRHRKADWTELEVLLVTLLFVGSARAETAWLWETKPQQSCRALLSDSRAWEGHLAPKRDQFVSSSHRLPEDGAAQLRGGSGHHLLSATMGNPAGDAPSIPATPPFPRLGCCGCRPDPR